MATSSKKSFRPSLEKLEDRKMMSVTWHGGPVLPHVQAENLYYGSKWNQAGGLQSAHYLQGFTSTIVNSSFMDALTGAGYGVGRGTAVAGSILNYNLGTTLTDGQIQAGVEQAIRTGHAAQPGANNLYVVFVEPGVAVYEGGGSSARGSFTGYHSYFVGADAYGIQRYIQYAVIAYPGGGVNPTPQQYGYKNEAAEITDTASHEIAEAVTDPHLNAWYDNSRGEIGDITENYHQYLGDYYVQLVASQTDVAVRVTNGTVYRHPAAGCIAASRNEAPVAADNHALGALDALFAELPSQQLNGRGLLVGWLN